MTDVGELNRVSRVLVRLHVQSKTPREEYVILIVKC